MKLYLSAKTKSGIGYIPSWICLTFNDTSSITLDICGKNDYETHTLDCCVTGGLRPSFAWDSNGNEQKFTELSEYELDKLYPGCKILELFEKAISFTVGFYPAVDSRLDGLSNWEERLYEKARKDEFKECAGKIEFFNRDYEDNIICNDKLFERDFIFDIEIERIF